MDSVIQKTYLGGTPSRFGIYLGTSRAKTAWAIEPRSPGHHKHPISTVSYGQMHLGDIESNMHGFQDCEDLRTYSLILAQDSGINATKGHHLLIGSSGDSCKINQML